MEYALVRMFALCCVYWMDIRYIRSCPFLLLNAGASALPLSRPDPHRVRSDGQSVALWLARASLNHAARIFVAIIASRVSCGHRGANHNDDILHCF